MKIRTIKIDDKIDESIDALNKQLALEGEKIVFMSQSDGYLFVAVDSVRRSTASNLLLEEIRARGTKNNVGT